MPGAGPVPVSVYMITLNEADKIYRTLSRLKEFREIIIVDSGSTDATAEIAARFPNVRFSQRDWTSYSDQKAHALSLCDSEWVLNLDADEELTPGFMDELRVTLEDPDCVALETRRVMYRHGRRPNSFSRGNRLVRLFRKKHGHYEPRRVHESISVSGNVRRSNVFFIHHQDLTQEETIRKLNRYSQLRALDKFEAGSRSNLLLIGLIFPFSFIQNYLFKGQFLDGVEGFLGSMNVAYYNFMKYAKLWELQRARDAAGAVEHFLTAAEEKHL